MADRPSSTPPSSLPAVPPLDADAAARAAARLDRLTKPRGSLGRLETLVVTLAAIEADPLPEVRPATAVVVAADHGVARHGVSLYPQEVTAQMVRNFAAGGAAVSVLCRRHGVHLELVDAGVRQEVAAPGLIAAATRRGSGDIAVEPAMTEEEALTLVRRGVAFAEATTRRGGRLLIPGEMGIGNSTAAAAVTAALLGLAPEEAVGPGTGVTGERRRRKEDVVRRALARLPARAEALTVLAEVGGLEIAFLAGAILGAAAGRQVVLLDGLISSAAALVAARLAPAVSGFCVAAHLSPEPAHRRILEALGLEPLLALDMRLGEGSGALVAYPVLEAACRLHREMATFAEAEVAGPAGEAQT